MSSSQQYSLRWNNYFRHLTYALDNHRNNDDFVDVSLLCDGRKIKAHKVVLSACSSYFKEIFIENPHPHPIIIFKFIKFEDLNSIVEFMYQGEVNVQQEGLQSFLQTAELLAVEGLASEDKEKPRILNSTINDRTMKSIPSTIKSLSDNSVAITQTTMDTSLNNPSMSQGLTDYVQVLQQQFPQLHVQQQPHQIQTHVHSMQRPQQQQSSSSTLNQHYQINVTDPHQSVHIQQMNQHPATQSTNLSARADIHNEMSPNTGMAGLPISHNSTPKKRKLTFNGDDDNVYPTETENYNTRNDQDIAKSGEVTLLRGIIKMDMPEYIISDDQTSDDGGNKDTNANTSHNISQPYTSEYEILTESEIDEKFNQHVESDNNEITMDMGRLLNNSASSSVLNPTTAKTTEVSNTLQQSTENVSDTSSINNNDTIVLNINSKSDNKATLPSDLPSNKWTECQFCKMVITSVNLWRHIRTQHTPQPPRKCEICLKNFKNKYSLREHIRISHEQKLTLRSEN